MCTAVNEDRNDYKTPTILPDIKEAKKLLEKAIKVKNNGMIFNDKYTVEDGLQKICKLVHQALSALTEKEIKMLKVGDKVKITKSDLLDFGKVGKIAFVKNSEKSPWPYLVEFTFSYCTFRETDLEKKENDCPISI